MFFPPTQGEGPSAQFPQKKGSHLAHHFPSWYPSGLSASLQAGPPSLSPLGHRPPCLRPAAPKRPADHSRTGRHPAGPSPGPWARPPLAAASSSPFRAAFPSAQTCACAGLSLRRPSSPEPRAGWRAPNTRGAYLISVLQLECPAIPVRRPPRARNILPRPALLESGHVTRTALGPRRAARRSLDTVF